MHSSSLFHKVFLILALCFLTGCNLTAEDWQAINEGLYSASQNQASIYGNTYPTYGTGYYPGNSNYSISNNYPIYNTNPYAGQSIDYYAPDSYGSRPYERDVDSCQYSCGQVHDSCFSAANTTDNHGNGSAGELIYYCRAELHSCEQSCTY